MLDEKALRLKPGRGQSPVDEVQARKTLTTLWQSRAAVFGPGRRALPLKSFRTQAGEWQVFPFATAAQQASRDAAALRLFWDSRPKTELRQLRLQQTHEAFGALMQAWNRFSAEVATGLGFGTQLFLNVQPLVQI